MSLLNNNVNNIDHPHVNMLIPPPVLLIILGLSAVGIHWLKWNGFDVSSGRAFIGGLVILSGFLLMSLCVLSFRKEQTPVRPNKMPTSKIVRQRIYP